MKTHNNFTRLFVFLFFYLFLFSCEKEELKDEKSPEGKEITGIIILPYGCQISESDLNIITPAEVQQADDDGVFSAITLPNNKPQLLVVTNRFDDLVLLGMMNTDLSEQMEISAASTAKALILINPLFAFTSDQQRMDILDGLEMNEAFQELVSDIESLLAEDPENVLNYDAHPRIYEQAVKIVFSILKDNLADNKSTQDFSGVHVNPWIEASSSSKITIYNPTTAHFASEINTLGSSEDSEIKFICAKDGIVSFQFGWPPVYFTEPQATECDVADGSYQIRMTKGFDFSVDLVDFFNPTQAHGLATLANTGKFGLIMFDLVVGLDLLPEVSFTDLHLDLVKTSKEMKDLSINVSKNDYMAALGNLVGIVLANADEFAYWLWQEAAKDATRHYVVQTFSVLKKVAVVTNIVSTGETFANQLVPFLYDMFSGDRWISYNISLEDGKLTNNVANTSPLKPVIWSDQQWSTAGDEVTFYGSTTDPDGHKVSFRFHWGDGTSTDWTPLEDDGNEVNMQHGYDDPGNYNVVVEVKDELGGISELSNYCSIHITDPGSSFQYNFDNDITYLYPSNPPWTSEVKEPSYLRVESAMHFGNSGKSCAFYDYDPSIDQTDGDEYAMIYSKVECKSQGKISFKWRIENSDGHFGLRTWESYGNWKTMGYYVLFNGGKISYYYNNSFHTLKYIDPEVWYTMQLDYDIELMKYDIYIDQELIADNIPFVGNPSKLEYLQVVAFSDATCRTAYIDEIEIFGGTLKSTVLPKSTSIQKNPAKIKP